MEEKIATASRAVLITIVNQDHPLPDAERDLCELERLLDTAGGETAARILQNKESPDPRTAIGSGKVKELAELCQNESIPLVIFDGELTPSQIRNLEDELSSPALAVRVIDRTMLILDIFALHAVTGEGKLQVELAQLRYTAPRLTGRGTDLSRLGGGIGTRGPGESKLESDRRHLKRRIEALEQELDAMKRTRQTMRASRDRSGLLKLAIVGYTNAGKSTLLNRLTDAGILAQDRLFATLDPTTRRLELPCGESVLLTDTVGFIRNLPHQLVKAFQSTLEEAALADVLLLVLDASDPECADQLAVTEQVLAELGAGEKPKLYVFNKCDTAEPEASLFPDLPPESVVRISARQGDGIDGLLAAIEGILQAGKRRIRYHIPNSRLGQMNLLYSQATVESVDYGPDCADVTAVVDAKTRGMMEAAGIPGDIL